MNVGMTSDARAQVPKKVAIDLGCVVKFPDLLPFLWLSLLVVIIGQIHFLRALRFVAPTGLKMSAGAEPPNGDPFSRPPHRQPLNAA